MPELDDIIPDLPEHTSTTLGESLANARRQIKEKNLADFVIVDADAHHYETSYAPWKEIAKYIEDDTIRLRVESAMNRNPGGKAPSDMIAPSMGDRTIGGRIQRRGLRKSDIRDGESPEAAAVKRAMESMGIDYSILFPTPLLNV